MCRHLVVLRRSCASTRRRSCVDVAVPNGTAAVIFRCSRKKVLAKPARG
jgi:hypothetical protein